MPVSFCLGLQHRRNRECRYRNIALHSATFSLVGCLNLWRSHESAWNYARDFHRDRALSVTRARTDGLKVPQYHLDGQLTGHKGANGLTQMTEHCQTA